MPSGNEYLQRGMFSLAQRRQTHSAVRNSVLTHLGRLSAGHPTEPSVRSTSAVYDGDTATHVLLNSLRTTDLAGQLFYP
jgi:hypothetical protein